MPKFVPAKKKAAVPPPAVKGKGRPSPKSEEPKLSSEELHRRAVAALVSMESRDRRMAEFRARMGSGSATRAQQLRDRQADARSVGWPEPIALTEWGECVYGYGADGRPITTCQRGGPSAVNTPTADMKERPAPTPVGPAVPKKPGVVKKILECLRAASKKRPATKESILAVLVKAFPERDPKAMSKTIGSQVNGAMKVEKGIDVSTDGAGGYWVSK